MTPRLDWVLLAYPMPRDPSTARVTVWRKLRRLGVLQLVDGLVALPADAHTKEQLEWIADEVLGARGDATVWVGRPRSAADERRIATRMAAALAEEYRTVLAEVAQATPDGEPGRRRALSRLQRELHRIGRRDFFPPPERDQARGAVRRLAAEWRWRSLKWATRAGIHVDRAAFAWLLRRFVDPDAEFVFVDDADARLSDATAFDMRGVELSHHGGNCSFETILRRHEVSDPVLWDVAPGHA